MRLCALLLLVCLFFFIYVVYNLSESKLQWAEKDDLS